MKLFVLLSLFAVVYGQNYCQSNLCPSGTHIACNNNGAWASTCPAGASLVDITPYINTILASHNQKRGTIARGALSPFPQAKQMAIMQWDNELANLAALNVKQCAMRHDSCRSTASFKYAGQNLGIMGYKGITYTDEYLINNRIDAWWAENKDAKPEQLASYPNGYSGPAIGHFTVMAAEKNVRTGCAAARYVQNGWNYFLFACNYATTNIINRPIYNSGTTGSGCKTGRDTYYTSLCSKSETYSQP